MAKNSYSNTPTSQYTYDQMMHRRHEIKDQSPWLEDYEIDALLADEGYNVSEKAPEGYVFSTGEEESGIDFVGTESATLSEPLKTSETERSSKADPYAPYLEQMVLDDLSDEDLSNEDEGVSDTAPDVEVHGEKEGQKQPTASREEYLASQKERQLRDKARKLLKKNIREETGKMSIALIIYIVLQLVITGLVTAYLLLVARYRIAEINVFLATPTNMLPLQGIILVMGLGLPFIAYMYLFKLPLGEMVPVRRIRAGNFALLVVFGMGFSATVTYIANVISNGTFVAGGFTNSANVLADNKGIGLLYSVICLCIIPALVEEFVFRGVILQTLRRKGGDTFAILTSALMCALVYSNTQGIGEFFISLLMGYLVVFSGSVIPAITVGLLRSAFSLTITLMNMTLDYEKVTAIDALSTVVTIAAGLIAVAAILKRYPDFFRIKEGKSSLSLREKMTVAVSSPGMIFLILYFIFFTILEKIPTEAIIGRLK